MISSSKYSLRLGALAVAMSLCFATPVIAGKLNTSALKDGQTYDRFIVRFNKNAPERSNAAARQQLLDAAGRGNGVGIGQLRRLAVGADVIKTDRKLNRMAAQQLMQRLASNPHVEYVELDAVLKPLLTPNDTSYASQWHYYEATAGINLPAAWNQATGSGVVVAVIDTGITTHTDLAAISSPVTISYPMPPPPVTAMAVIPIPTTKATGWLRINAILATRHRTPAGMAPMWQARLRR